MTERLSSPLTAEDQTVQSMPDVSPTKWHRGHTTWFFETFLLLPHLAEHRPVEPAYSYLFNSYYEAVGERHPRAERGNVSRPGIAEVAEYRRRVDGAMRTLLSRTLEDDVLDLVELGIHHEQQHQELLLMDVKHVLSCSPLLPAYCREPRVAASGREPRKVQWIGHPGGTTRIGVSGSSFAFDNERPRHTESLVPFEMSDRLVTCAQWSDFIADGGYARPELWLSEGWATVQAQHWTAPLYWRDGDEFTLFGARPIDPAEPVVHVSYFEADAFARWAGARLPTEAEWETFATTAGDEPPAPGTLRSRLHPAASDDLQAFGHVWQWTSTSYGPYPGFRTAPGAVGEYNGKFMVNQQVLRGSACVTPDGHARTSYRNFFPPSARWAFCGLRLARDV